MKLERFPIVSDDEIMLTEMPFMNLYDESDLISSIMRLPSKTTGMVANYYRKPLVQATDKLPGRRKILC